MPGHSLPSGEREQFDQEFLSLQKRTFLVSAGYPRRLTNLEVTLHTADPGTPADRRDTGSLKKRITLPYWRHDRRRHWRNHRRADLSGGAGASTAASQIFKRQSLSLKMNSLLRPRG